MAISFTNLHFPDIFGTTFIEFEKHIGLSHRSLETNVCDLGKSAKFPGEHNEYIEKPTSGLLLYTTE